MNSQDKLDHISHENNQQNNNHDNHLTNMQLETSENPKKTINREESNRSIAEWFSLGISIVILTVIIGLVVYLGQRKQYDRPPELVVFKTEKARVASGQYYIPFTVKNTGGETAESVQIIAELEVDGKVTETGEQQIDFLSGGEIETGAFIFTRNPAKGKLMIRVASYKLP